MKGEERDVDEVIRLSLELELLKNFSQKQEENMTPVDQTLLGNTAALIIGEKVRFSNFPEVLPNESPVQRIHKIMHMFKPLGWS